MSDMRDVDCGDTKYLFPIGSHVLERAYPKYARGVVTGHAPDGWTFVKWDTGNTLSYPPHQLALIAEEQ